MSYIQEDRSSLYKANLLTEEQEIKAKMLAPETIALFENEIAQLTDALVTTRFSPGNQEELHRQLAQFVFMQAKRETLTALLSECSDAYAQIANRPTV